MSPALLLRALSAGFASPDSAWRQRFDRLVQESGGLAPLDGCGVCPTGLELRPLSSMLAEIPLEALQAEHFRLFGPSAECPLELALHLSDNPFEQAKIMAEMAGFYRAFGVQSQPGVRPDGLPVCLEFFSYLCLKLAWANPGPGADAAEVTQKALQGFRRDFLLPGLTAFLERLQALTDNRFYIALGELALEAVRRCEPSG